VATSPAGGGDDDVEVGWTGRALSGATLVVGVAEGDRDLDELRC